MEAPLPQTPLNAGPWAVIRQDTCTQGAVGLERGAVDGGCESGECCRVGVVGSENWVKRSDDAWGLRRAV